MSNPTPSPYRLGAIIENDEGKFTMIREQGPANADGAYDAELWAKEGVDQSHTVYLRSLSGDHFNACPA